MTERWRASGVCRYCQHPATNRWFSIWVCDACYPRVQSCRYCRGVAPAVSFAHKKTRICDACATPARRPTTTRTAPRALVVDRKRNLRHLKWIRQQPCAINDHTCGGMRIGAHHCRENLAGATGIKPSDDKAVPLCLHHHHEGHHGGWRTFSLKYDVDLPELARRYAARSPFIGIDTRKSDLLNPFSTAPERAHV